MKLPVQPVLILTVLLVIAVSGCITDDPSILMKANPLVSQFLENHPNAEIRVVHYTPAEAEAVLDDLMEDCQKLNMSAKDYYKITIEDVGDEFFVTVWIDWENRLIECAIKKGGEPANETCKSHYNVRCYGSHAYWYDSCGNKEEIKELCGNGCDHGRCIGHKKCEEMGGYCTYPLASTVVGELSAAAGGTTTGMVYGTDTSAITGGGESCERYYTCPGGENVKYCELISEREPVTCTESSAGKVCSAANISTKCICKENPEYLCTERPAASCREGYTETGYWCPESGTCCIPETNCTYHNETRCYGGHVYWYDSCGNRGEKKEYCPNGCDDGRCIGINLTRGLVAHYKFEWNAHDSSGNNNHGTVYGAAFADGISGKAASFNGSNYVKVDASTIDGDYSIPSSFAFWVYPITGGKLMRKGDSSLGIGCDYEPDIHINNSGIITPTADGCKGSSTIGSTQLQLNEWNHVVIIFTSSLGKIYVNGELKVSNAKTYSFTSRETGQNNLYIGGTSYFGNAYGSFDGMIDELKIWNYPLTASEVLDDYNSVTHNQTNCTTHHEHRCYGGHVYWYDSCGDREEKREDCTYGCSNGVCVQNQTNCTSQHEAKCYGGHVYWYDSCGDREEKKENCSYGCENGTCVQENVTGTMELHLRNSHGEMIQANRLVLHLVEMGPIIDEVDINNGIAVFNLSDIQNVSSDSYYGWVYYYNEYENVTCYPYEKAWFNFSFNGTNPVEIDIGYIKPILILTVINNETGNPITDAWLEYNRTGDIVVGRKADMEGVITKCLEEEGEILFSVYTDSSLERELIEQFNLTMQNYVIQRRTVIEY